MMLHKIKYLLFFLISMPIYGAIEYLDSTFGPNFNGIVTTDIGLNSKINDIAYTNGKIIVVGSAFINNIQNIIIAKYNIDGTLDNSFGSNGVVNTPVDSEAAANALTIDANNNIVVAGYHNNGKNNLLILRYTPNGQLDLNFGVGGKVSKLVGTGTIANDITIDLNGKILAVGTAVLSSRNNLVITRYLSNGNIDTSFGTNGVKTLVANNGYIGNSIKIDASSKIVAAGVAQLSGDKSNFLIVRLNINGSNDNTFGSSGVTTTVVPNNLFSGLKSLTINSNGKYVVAGYAGSTLTVSQVALARYNLNGTLDTSFGSNLNGIQITNIGSNSTADSVLMDLNQKMVAAGFSDNNSIIARYNDNGSLDTSFGIAGILEIPISVTSKINNLTIQSDGRIISGGFSSNIDNKSQMNVIRFNKNNFDFVNITSISNKNIHTKIPIIAGTSNIPNAQVQVIINGQLFKTVSTDNIGNWSADNTNVLPIGENTIRVNLIQNSVSIVSQVIKVNVIDNFGEDSLFVYNTSAQTSTLSQYISVPFNNLVKLGTWSTQDGITFTCNKSGTYLIEYAANAGVTGTINTQPTSINVSTMVAIDNIEYLGSEATASIDLNTFNTRTLTRSFLKNINSGQTISFKFAVNINGGTGPFSTGLIISSDSIGIQPVYSLSVTRNN